MGISAVQYRIHIGCFQPSFRKLLKVQTRTQISSRMMTWLQIFLCIVILSPTRSPAAHPAGNLCDDKSMCIIPKKSLFIPYTALVNTDSYFYTYKQGLNGFSSQETNKVCHSSYGNKDKPGGTRWFITGSKLSAGARQFFFFSSSQSTELLSTTRQFK